jgi:hypothetical protein
MSIQTVVSMEGMQKVLQEVRDLLQRTLTKESFSLLLSATCTEWSQRLSGFYLDPKKRYEAALVNLETYYSIPNIDSANNSFVYSMDSGATWKTKTIPEGSYELSAINGEIQRQMKASGDWNSASNEYCITLGGNTSTLRAFLEITSPTCRVDMAQSTIRSLLGFAPETVPHGYTEASNPVNILSVDSIRVECDLIDNSYVDGERAPVVYSFFPNAQPGEKVIERPEARVYLPISKSGNIERVHIALKDQTGKLLNLRGETITMRLHIRSA